MNKTDLNAYVAHAIAYAIARDVVAKVKPQLAESETLSAQVFNTTIAVGNGTC